MKEVKGNQQKIRETNDIYIYIYMRRGIDQQILSETKKGQ